MRVKITIWTFLDAPWIVDIESEWWQFQKIIQKIIVALRVHLKPVLDVISHFLPGAEAELSYNHDLANKK